MELCPCPKNFLNGCASAAGLQRLQGCIYKQESLQQCSVFFFAVHSTDENTVFGKTTEILSGWLVVGLFNASVSTLKALLYWCQVVRAFHAISMVEKDFWVAGAVIVHHRPTVEGALKVFFSRRPSPGSNSATSSQRGRVTCCEPLSCLTRRKEFWTDNFKVFFLP